MDDGEEDYVFYGTPIEREEETSRRKRKAIAEAGQLRSLPSWKQEVRDEEGRRRFHGAFTGGFSAGYYNTVGSKEGWMPQTFTSSRKNRAEVKQQSIYNFLDEDEKSELEGHALETSSQFDTFGFTAAELARKQADKEHQKRPSAIPGPIPDEIVLPAANSIGIRLLLKMGWRQGMSIKDAHSGAMYDARRRGRKALLAFSGGDEKSEPAEPETNDVDSNSIFEKPDDIVFDSRSTPVFVINPKRDLYGLGYDPFKHAPEFRERKSLHLYENKDGKTNRGHAVKGGGFTLNSGKVAPGFGIGALEEMGIEDEDIYASSEFEESYVQEVEQPSTVDADNRLKLQAKEEGALPGFRAASRSDYIVERFHVPIIPQDFLPIHKFTTPLEFPIKVTDLPPPEVPAPEEKDLKLLIDGFATLVSRCGKLFEDVSREKNKDNPLFSFLNDGKGHGYYVRKLWEEQQKHVGQQKRKVDYDTVLSAQKMTAESRGRILGERPLERADNIASSAFAPKDFQMLSNLSDTFMKPLSLVGLPESAKAFGDDPAKQERFEQFLKDKYQGGLRSTYAGNSNMSEVDRARERVDFEAAAEAIAQGENTKAPAQQLSIVSGSKFISGGVEQNNVSQHEGKKEKTCPKREEFQWRPSPVLCKRFDITDPFMGKPPPPPRAKSKMDSLLFMTDAFKVAKVETADATRDVRVSTQSGTGDPKEQILPPGTDNQSSDIMVERPVDLYKAIFSDDSEDEEDNPVANAASNPENKAEGANLTLNRLIAGDFLESLGKELGLEVPDAPYSSKTKQSETASKKMVSRDTSRDENPTTTAEVMTSDTLSAHTSASSLSRGMRKDAARQNDSAPSMEVNHCQSPVGFTAILPKDSYVGAGIREQMELHVGEATTEKKDSHVKGHTTHARPCKRTSSSSDTDSSTHHKHHRHHRRRRSRIDKLSSPGTESSGSHSGEYSKSRKRKKSSSHRSRKHSKHQRDKSRQSPSKDSISAVDKDKSDHKRESRTIRERDGRRNRH